MIRTKGSVSMMAFLVVGFVAGGCAVGNKHSYLDVVANVHSSDTITVAVATHDRRAYVVSGRKNPNFVGLQRGGYGNPWNVSTASGNSLADDMTHALKASLGAKGYKVTPVIFGSSIASETAIAKLKGTGARRSILLTLTEWKSDTFNNTALHYDVRIDALDANGKRLADDRIQGVDILGGSFWNPPAHAKKAVPNAFKAKLEQLLNSPNVAQALR